MEMSTLTLVRRQIEFLPADSILRLPPDIFGIYVLYEYHSRPDAYDVRYVGVASSSKTADARTVLERQRQGNGFRWTHCSVFELWGNITSVDDAEIDQLFYRIYSRDTKLKPQLTRWKKKELDENSFVPRELFIKFIKQMPKL